MDHVPPKWSVLQHKALTILWDAEHVLVASVSEYQCGPWTKGSAAHCLRVTTFLDVNFGVTGCYLLVGLTSENSASVFKGTSYHKQMFYVLNTRHKVLFILNLMYAFSFMDLNVQKQFSVLSLSPFELYSLICEVYRIYSLMKLFVLHGGFMSFSFISAASGAARSR